MKSYDQDIRNRLVDAFIIVIFVLLISIIVFRHYIFGGYYLLSKDNLGDSLRVTLPAYYNLYDNLFGGNSGFWSWRMGLGTSMIALADITFDPLTYIVFIRGRAHIPDMLVWHIVARFVSMGLAFYCYISYFKLSRYARVVSSVMYAFCGISIVNGDFPQLGAILTYFPLLCLGIEMWLDMRKRLIMIVALFLISIYFFYYYFVAGILSVLYVFMRVIKKTSIKKTACSCLSFGFYYILALCFSAFSSFPQIDLMLNSPRVLSGNDIKFSAELIKPYSSTLITALIRAMGLNLLTGRDSSFLGIAYKYNDQFQMLTYSSTLFFLMIVLMLYYKREYRKYVLAISAVCMLCISVPLFSFVTNAFSAVNYRWIFGVSLAMTVAMAFSLETFLEKDRISIVVGILGVLVSFIVLFGAGIILGLKSGNISEFIRSLYQGSMKYYCTATCICLMTICVFLVRNKYLSCGLLALLIIVDIIINMSFMYNNGSMSFMDYTEANNACYTDNSAVLVSSIMEEDDGFYRMNKDFDSVIGANDQNSCNDAMVQGYYGLKCYSSFNNKNYVHYLWYNDVYVTPAANVEDYIRLGVKPENVWNGQELNYIEGVYDRYDLMNYLGVRYYLTKDRNKVLPPSYIPMYEQNGIYVFKNTEAYPLAFVDKGNVKEMQDAFKLKEFTPDRVKFEIDVAEDDSEVTFSMPYDRDWHIYTDGEKTVSHQLDNFLLGCRLGSGRHIVELVYRPTVFYIGIVISFLTMVIFVFAGHLNLGVWILNR